MALLLGPMALHQANAATGDVTAAPNGRDVFPGQKTTDLQVANPGATTPATVTIKNARGAVVRTFSTPPACFSAACAPAGPFDGYIVRWDGKNQSGALLPSAAYTGTILFSDSSAVAHNTSLGTIWINHLVTRTRSANAIAEPDPSLHAFQTVGRCSSVVSGPGSFRQLRLLSLRFCASTAGSDDWAFAAQRLTHSEVRGQRLISVRVGAVGSPVSAGDFATVVVDTSAGKAARPTWRRVATLQGTGTHWATTLTVPTDAQRGPDYQLLVQGRTTNGNRYRITQWLSQWTYRGWAR